METNAETFQRHNGFTGLQALVLLLVTVICGWRAFSLGYYDDDPRIFWYVGDAPHPVVLTDGRFTLIILFWVFWNLLGDYPGWFHIFHIVIHLLVVRELFLCFRILGIRESAAAAGTLFFALCPVFHEALYWVPALFYPLAVWLFLCSVRLFAAHLEQGRVRLLAAAAACYFIACGTIELLWCFCIVFPLLQWVLQSRAGLGHRTPSAHQWLTYWRSVTLMGVAVLAVTVYLYFNSLSNRIERSGGFLAIEQIPSNLLLLLRSAITWPKRQLVTLIEGTWLDILNGVHLPYWFFYTILLVLLAMLFRILENSQRPDQEERQGVRTFVAIAISGSLFFFLPTILMSVVKPVLSSRVFYVFFLGSSLCVAACLECVWRLLRGATARTGFRIFLSVGVAIYVLGAACMNLSIQDVLARSWSAQRQFQECIRERVGIVDAGTRFYFVGDTRLVESNLELKMLSNQIQLDYLATNLLGLKRPDLLQASTIHLRDSGLRRDGRVVWEPPLSSGGQAVARTLGGLNLEREVVLLGFEEGQPVLYDGIWIVGETGTIIQQIIPNLSKQIKGPFLPLVVKLSY